jgi:hypothetical protein
VFVEEFDVLGERLFFREWNDVNVLDERREFFRCLDDSDTILLNVVIDDVGVLRETAVCFELVREVFARSGRVGEESDDVEFPRGSKRTVDEVL